MTVLAHQSKLSILNSQSLENIVIKNLIHPLNITFTTYNFYTIHFINIIKKIYMTLMCIIQFGL